MSCAPCQADAPPLGIPGTYATSTEPAPPPPQDAAGWEGILGFEGVLTGDSRLIERNALVWDTPLPLRFVKEDIGGHQNAVVVGRNQKTELSMNIVQCERSISVQAT